MITNIVLENFKKFKYLRINDLKRAVLISGRNNIGKSSILEALFLYMDHSAADSFGKLNGFRGITGGGTEGLWEPLFFNRDTSLPISIEVASEDKTGRLEFRRDDNYLPADINGISEDVIAQFRTVTREAYSLGYSYKCDDYTEQGHFSLSNTSILRDIKTSLTGNEIIGMVPTQFKNGIFMRDYNTLVNTVGKLELTGEKSKLIKVLQNMDPSIEDILTVSVKGITQLYVKGEGGLVPLQYSGDGVIKLINICMAIMEQKNGLLLIDEMENGLHYSMYGKLWTMIDRISKEVNCQVIATTHSYELISAVKSGFEHKEDFVFYRLGKIKDNISSFRFDYEMLDNALKSEMEIR